jgi:hypothetical protein
VRPERFVNRYRGEITSGANSATAVAATINTGMNVGRADAFKWVLLGASLMPKHDELGVVIAASGTTNAFHAQLCIGTQAAFLDGDDMQVICEGHKSNYWITSGVAAHDWPMVLDVIYPLPVFAQTLTLLIKTNVDNAQLQNFVWTFTLWYVMQGIAQGEIVEYLAAFGQV